MDPTKITTPFQQAASGARSPRVKPQLGGINWRLVMKHAKQTVARTSEVEAQPVITVQKKAVPPGTKIGRWEIFDEGRLRRIRINYVLSFAAGIVLAAIVCYANFIAPMADKMAALEKRESELTQVVGNFEVQTQKLSNILEGLEVRLQNTNVASAVPAPAPAPSIVSGAALRTVVRRRGTGAVAFDASRQYYDTQIDTGY